MPEVPAIPLLDKAAATGRTAVKACGFREKPNLLEALRSGVDAIGLNFWPKSKRYVDPAEAASWIAEMPPQVLRVGVFVDPSDEDVLSLWRTGLIQVAQLHGNELPDQCARLMAAGVPLIKATGFREAADLARAVACGTPYVLVDAHAPGAFGGTGCTVDWAAVREAWRHWPEARLILSGGLGPENVGEAVSAVRPCMVDAASGVESAPGLKDPSKVARFVRNSRVVS